QTELFVRRLPPFRERVVTQPLHLDVEAGVDLGAFALSSPEGQPFAEVAVSEVMQAARLVEQIAIHVRQPANYVCAAAAVVRPIERVVGGGLVAAWIIGLGGSLRTAVRPEVLRGGDVLVVGEGDRLIRVPTPFGVV